MVSPSRSCALMLLSSCPGACFLSGASVSTSAHAAHYLATNLLVPILPFPRYRYIYLYVRISEYLYLYISQRVQKREADLFARGGAAAQQR